MSLNNWVESELERRVSEIRKSADVDIAAANANASQEINRSVQEYNNQKSRKHKDDRFTGSLGISLFQIFFVIGGCYGVYSQWTRTNLRQGFLEEIFVTPIVFVVFGAICGVIAFVFGVILQGIVAGSRSVSNVSNEKKYSKLSKDAEDSVNESKNEEIKRIVERRDKTIKEITEKYNFEVKQAYERFFNSSYVGNITDFLYKELLESVTKANHASYIKNLNVVFWFHIYLDRIDTYFEELVEEGSHNTNTAHPLTQKQFVLKHQMLRNLETDEQCDALAEAIIVQMKEKVLANDEFSSVNGERRGAHGKVNYKTPNPDVKAFIGF